LEARALAQEDPLCQYRDAGLNGSSFISLKNCGLMFEIVSLLKVEQA
jgi:hypothetical protein